MTLSELKQLVKKGEGQHLEFKKKADFPEKIVREMVAFANWGGGILLLGVDDAGRLSGLKFPDEEQFVMEAALAKYAKPSIPFQLQSIPIGQGLFVLQYRILNGLEKPYFWLTDQEKQVFRAFVRYEDQSIQASKEVFQILKWDPNRKGERPFQLNALEKKMLHHFNEHPFLTLKDLQKLGNLPPWRASNLLINWVKQGVLEVKPNPNGDLFLLALAYRSQ
jgi:predicted HTH transcriptional regulator